MKIIKKILKYILLAFPLLLLGYVIVVRTGIINKYSRNQPFELLADMDHQKRVLPESSDTMPNGAVPLMLTPDSSIPFSGTKYHFEQVDYFVPESTFVNPLPDNDEILRRGKARFETFCVPCHNHDGKGKGVIVTKANLKPGEEGFPEPANLTRPESKRLTDGRLFHILSSGQNLMFPQTDKLNETERWAVIKYIRFLQNKP